MKPDPARPYVRATSTQGNLRYELVEPCTDDRGRPARRIHRLGMTDDPHAALARLAEQVRDRESWASLGLATGPEERKALEDARRRLAALAAAVARMGRLSPDESIGMRVRGSRVTRRVTGDRGKEKGPRGSP